MFTLTLFTTSCGSGVDFCDCLKEAGQDEAKVKECMGDMTEMEAGIKAIECMGKIMEEGAGEDSEDSEEGNH